MKNKFLKIFSFIILTIALICPISNFAFDLDSLPDGMDSKIMSDSDSKETTNEIARNAGYNENLTAIEMVNRVIKIIIGLSATISIILILIAGVKYMFSKGDTAAIKKSLKLMMSGFIGIAIMATAYITSNFIVKQIENIVYNDIKTGNDINSSSDYSESESGSSGEELEENKPVNDPNNEVALNKINRDLSVLQVEYNNYYSEFESYAQRNQTTNNKEKTTEIYSLITNNRDNIANYIIEIRGMLDGGYFDEDRYEEILDSMNKIKSDKTTIKRELGL